MRVGRVPKCLTLEQHGPADQCSISTGRFSTSTGCAWISTRPLFPTSAIFPNYLSLSIEKREREEGAGCIHGLAELPKKASTGSRFGTALTRGNHWMAFASRAN